MPILHEEETEKGLISMITVKRNDDISVLGLSVRTFNCLHNSNINTIGEMLDYPRDDFIKIRNMGTKSLKELFKVLNDLQGENNEYMLINDDELSSDSLITLDNSDNVIMLNEAGEAIQNLSIKALPLSVRSRNCLINNGYEHAFQLINLTYNKLINLKNMGKKSVKEVLQYLKKITITHDSTLVSRTIILNDLGIVVQDIAIEKTPLSIRSKNCLINNGYTHVSNLIGVTFQELINIPSMGRKSVKELCDYLSKTIITTTTSTKTHRLNTYKDLLIEELIHVYGEKEEIWQRELEIVQSKFPEASGEFLVYRLYDSTFVRGIVKAKIIQLLEENGGTISKVFIEKWEPKHLKNTVILNEMLLELESSYVINIGDSLICRQYPSITRFVTQIKDERTKAVLKARLDGKTLQEVGNLYGLTRERVRQIILKALKGRPRIHEDQYGYIFANYNLSQENMSLAFSEPLSTYYYLEMTITQPHIDKKPVEESLTDRNIPINFRKKLEKVVHKDYVIINGLRVKKQKAEVIKAIIRTCCNQTTKINDFIKKYYAQIEELGLSKDESFVLNKGSCINTISGYDFVLWNRGQRFRYYDVSEFDFSELLTVLDLKQYNNLEISTLKLFRDNSDLMKQYNILDEYELHNLLKKIWPSNERWLKFKKMPTLEIGAANQKEQIRKLLFQLAPIAADDFAKIYEAEYGVKADTFRGAHLRDFDCYFHNGVYSVNYAELPKEQYMRMKKLLVYDFYTISELQQLYKQEYPHCDEGVFINPYMLKRMNFRVYSGYVIKDKHATASDYFRQVLTSEDIVDLKNINNSFQASKAYISELDNLKANYELIEFSPQQYINLRRLNTVGITKKDLRQFCKTVASRYEKGEYFTIKSLRQSGFTHEFDDLGFEDWFYSSILWEDKIHFSCQRMGGARLFCRGMSRASFSDMLVRILEKLQKIDVYDLLDLLDKTYGIKIRKDKLTAITSNVGLYYDTIMETVYVDYETYFEEI